MNDRPKRFMVNSTIRRIEILNALAEQQHQDIHSIINNLIMEWVLNDIDDSDLIKPIKEIFAN